MCKLCPKCSKIGAILLLILGVLFLLVDFGVWNFAGIQWWSAILVIVGVVGLASSGCKACQAIKK